VLSNSIQQLLIVITNGRREVNARTLTSVCKNRISHLSVIYRLTSIWHSFDIYIFFLFPRRIQEDSWNRRH